MQQLRTSELEFKPCLRDLSITGFPIELKIISKHSPCTGRTFHDWRVGWLDTQDWLILWGIIIWIKVLNVIEPKGLLIYNPHLHVECMESFWKLLIEASRTKGPVGVTACNWRRKRIDEGNRIVDRTLPGWKLGGPIAFIWAITPVNSDSWSCNDGRVRGLKTINSIN